MTLFSRSFTRKIGALLVAKEVTLQRVRNRIIECLEWIVEYKPATSKLGLNDLVNYWGDWVAPPIERRNYSSPTFTASEFSELQRVDAAMTDFIEATPDYIVDEYAATLQPEWRQLLAISASAYEEYMVRGKLPEA